MAMSKRKRTLAVIAIVDILILAVIVGVLFLRNSSDSAVDELADLDVVLRDADLFRDIDRHLFERVLVGDPLNKRDQDVKPGFEGPAVFAEVLDDEGLLLRDDRGRLGDDDDREND